MKKNHENKGDELVTAAIYDSDIQANIAMGMLESNGIDCCLMGGLINNVLAIHLTSVDGVRLMVHRRNLDEAVKLLTTDGDI